MAFTVGCFNTAWEMYLHWYDSYVVGILQWSLAPFIYNFLSQP
jgi:hypothetical protein